MKWRKMVCCIGAVVSAMLVKANDGVFYVNGSELKPIFNTDVSVVKELLSIKKIAEDKVQVNVYYEFYNESEAKTVTVGFEVFPPEWNAGETLEDQVQSMESGDHPYMKDFMVTANGARLPFKHAFVSDSLYAANGKINAIDRSKIQHEFTEAKKENWPGMYAGANMFVYYFDMHFLHGKNVISHSYECQLSFNIVERYNFLYVLSAAKRWGNGRIGDFTLMIDMGDFAAFAIPESFFHNSGSWTLAGTGKLMEGNAMIYQGNCSALKCYVRNGVVVFHQKDFVPEGDLLICALDGELTFPSASRFDVKKKQQNKYSHLPYSIYEMQVPDGFADEFTWEVLINLPFARRGYMFKNQALQKYFDAIEWYIPDPNYMPVVDGLSEEEKQWMEKLSAVK